MLLAIELHSVSKTVIICSVGYEEPSILVPNLLLCKAFFAGWTTWEHKGERGSGRVASYCGLQHCRYRASTPQDNSRDCPRRRRR